MSRKIQFTLNRDGGVVTKVIGGQGRGCEELTKAFDGLGGGTQARELQPEWHMEDQERVREGE